MIHTRRRRPVAIAAVITLGGVGGPAVAPSCGAPGEAAPITRTPDPVVWAWSTPRGAAQYDEHFIMLVKVGVSRAHPPNLNATAAADSIRDQIVSRGLEAGRIAILLAYLGEGDGDPHQQHVESPALFRQWCDALPPPAWEPATGTMLDQCRVPPSLDSVALWWATPWMTEGVLETRAWIETFIARYQYWQDPDNTPTPLPDPTRFHFDTELRIQAISDDWLAAFVALEDDPRWSTAVLPGYDTETMSDLFAAAGFDAETDPDPGAPWWDPVNQDWVNWYQGLCVQLCDAAMGEALYGPIQAAWPAALCSNYETSLRIDQDHRYRTIDWYGGAPWSDLHWWGVGQIQAPAFYPVTANHFLPGETHWAATMRVHRDNLDAMIGSLPVGHDPTEIMPWIRNVNQPLSLGGPDLSNEGITKARMREMLTMLRGRMVREIGIWDTDVSEGSWNDMADALNQTWMYGLGAVVLVHGTQDPGAATGDLEYAIEDYFAVDAESVAAPPAGGYVTFETHFDPDPAFAGDPPQGNLDVRVEARLSPGSIPDTVAFSLSLFDFGDGTWDVVLDDTLTKTRKVFIAHGAAAGGQYIDTDGSVRVRLQCFDPATAAFTAEIDSVQVVEGD